MKAERSLQLSANLQDHDSRYLLLQNDRPGTLTRAISRLADMLVETVGASCPYGKIELRPCKINVPSKFSIARSASIDGRSYEIRSNILAANILPLRAN